MYSEFAQLLNKNSQLIDYKHLRMILSNFVKKITKDRDESHGWNHMKIVVDGASVVYWKEFGRAKFFHPIKLRNIFIGIIIVGWLHDVPDHKYDIDGQLNKQVL